VLSQYLTAIQSAGSQPPQETGLTCNSWYGKFHLEMHWWHAAHFALWNRPALLRRSLAWYRRILPIAREIARRQGYEGVRWPKMVGPMAATLLHPLARCSSGSSPIPLLWPSCASRQPAARLPGTLRANRLRNADFMASYAHWTRAHRYVLGLRSFPPRRITARET